VRFYLKKQVEHGVQLVIPYTCNPSYKGGRGRRIMIQGCQKARPYLKNKPK
jgi:hypothetical protein